MVFVADGLALPAIEWEPLSLGGSWSFDLPSSNPLDGDFKSIELARDLEFQVTATAIGHSARVPLGAAVPALRPGQMIAPIAAVSATRTGAAVLLREVSLGDVTGNLAGDIQRDLRATGARITFGDPTAAVSASNHCLVWCLNGPTCDDFPFIVRTDRSRVIRHERQRAGSPDRVRELRGSGFSLDSIPAAPPTCGVGPATLAAVPKSVPVDGTVRPAAIEFSLPSAAKAPEWDVLDPYLAGLSFAIGRRLIPVGFTLFDPDARQQLHDLRSAWAVDLRADCARPSMPPTAVSAKSLTELVPRFVALATQFRLIDAMWLVWLADSVPMDAALPNLASALESIMTAWFRSAKTKSGGKYMPDADWSALSNQPMKDLAAALAGRPNADRMERRARGANNFGVNERFERFFDELGLPVCDVELKAIAARNKAAHGGSFTATQYQWLANTTRAYRTLVARVILTLLEWNGDYVDYSTYGFPSRPLKNTLGGPENDGKPGRF